MSFLDCYNALYDVIKADTTLLGYVNSTQFLRGFRENYPYQDYTIILEPEEEIPVLNTVQYGKVPAPYRNKQEVIHVIKVYCRVILTISNEATIIGATQMGVAKKGILEVIEDVRHSIRLVKDLGYNRTASSVSKANASDTFALSSTKKFITVKINGSTRTGHNVINCGVASLSGTTIAANIQTELRKLGRHADDGYLGALCTYNSTTKKFTISTTGYDPDNIVVVTPGVSNDCSALLGFDTPTELAGRNITGVEFGTVVSDNVAYPVRYRVLPVQIREVTLN